MLTPNNLFNYNFTCLSCTFDWKSNRIKSQCPKCHANCTFSSEKHVDKDEPIDHVKVAHYNYGDIETIDYLEAKLSPAEFVGFLKGNVLKYISRAGHKDNEKEDYKKALYYLKKLENVTY